MPSLKSVINAAGLVGAVAGQYFPPTPEGLKVINSKNQEGVKISYKEVSDRRICGCPDLMLTELLSAWYLRNYPRRQIVFRLRASSAGYSERFVSRPKLPHKHILLVL